MPALREAACGGRYCIEVSKQHQAHQGTEAHAARLYRNSCAEGHLDWQELPLKHAHGRLTAIGLAATDPPSCSWSISGWVVEVCSMVPPCMGPQLR